MEKLVGKNVTLFCGNYFYTGKLTEVTEKFVTLAQPKIVYETGCFSSEKWEDAQAVCTEELHVMIDSIESFVVLNKK
jgi:hypothetical protein